MALATSVVDCSRCGQQGIENTGSDVRQCPCCLHFYHPHCFLTNGKDDHLSGDAASHDQPAYAGAVVLSGSTGSSIQPTTLNIDTVGGDTQLACTTTQEMSASAEVKPVQPSPAQSKSLADETASTCSTNRDGPVKTSTMLTKILELSREVCGLCNVEDLRDKVFANAYFYKKSPLMIFYPLADAVPFGDSRFANTRGKRTSTGCLQHVYTSSRCQWLYSRTFWWVKHSLCLVLPIFIVVIDFCTLFC